MKNLPFIIICLIFVALGCNESEKPSDSKPTSPAASPISQPTSATEEKSLPNLFELVNKSPAEIEKRIGKPRKVEKITDISSSLFDEEREYEVPPIVNPYSITIRFFKGKAVQFLSTLPLEQGTSEAQKLPEKFGFDVKNLKAEIFPTITNWSGTIKDFEFEKISAMKMSGDVFSHLTVIVRKK